MTITRTQGAISAALWAAILIAIIVLIALDVPEI